MALKRFFDKVDYSAKRTCTLKSLNPDYSDITLNESAIKIGRSEITRIKDSRCSRHQVMLKADLNSSVLHLKVCGVNPSGLNGFAVYPGKIYEVYNEDVIELLYGQYPYKVLFSNPTTSKKMKTDEATTKSNAKEGTWKTSDNGKLCVYTPFDEISSEKIAAYDLDGTLICTKSGKVFPQDLFDWKIKYSDIPNKLKSLQSLGYKIVIFTNQAAIGKGNLLLKDFQQKVVSILNKLGVSIKVFVSIAEGMFRKPAPGMWTYLQDNENNGIEISKEKSFYIGDAAGRTAISTKIKKDFSSADRLFALNVGIPFMTPEEHFLNEKARPYKLPAFDPSLATNTSWFSSNVTVPSKETEVIVLVGLPGSGKSFFSRTVLDPLKYNIINRDTVKSMEKCFTYCEKSLQDGKSCVIDNTNVDIQSRRKFVNIAKKHSIQCRCFVLNMTIEQIKHNIAFRNLIDNSSAKINDMILNSMKKKFVFPTKEEGFSEIVNVNFVPTFKNDYEEKLYKLYLVEK